MLFLIKILVATKKTREIFKDYEKYFSDPDRMGFGDDPDEYEDVDVDEIVEEYYKMGPADPDYMEEVKAKWTPES